MFPVKSSARVSAGFYRSDKGVTFVELLLVVALAAVVAAAAYPVISSTTEYYETESAMQLVLSSIRESRQEAVDGRRAFKLVFSAPGSIVIRRQNDNFSFVLDRRLSLPENVVFERPSGIPAISIISNRKDIDFGGKKNFRFLADGSAVNNKGQIISGVVYISHSARPDECRAVSVFGGTGLTRAWTYEGGQWE